MVTVQLSRLGFRTVALDATGGDFALSLNGVPIFCRGACWMPLDPATLGADPAEYRRTLLAVRAAGMNMVRVVGPAVYEADAFHDLCDELGILVWQDFMFANMDYPEDAAFVAAVQEEARQALRRWQGRPSLAMLCGDSEGEQQAAMWGAPPAAWQRPLFRETLPALCRELCPDVPYWPSSASGGDFPHQPNVGSTSYYGVGAYLRPLEDARRSGVRFASECLGFANVPEDTLWAAHNTTAPPAHTPQWKAGVPRDLGAGWDFDDVRDFYLRALFGVDPAALRSTDPERYLALGRITTGEVMEAAFAEWRRPTSPCRGALVWFLRDLVVGAGWGVLDRDGRPKAAYHYLRRALRPLAVFFSDEGLNGTQLHVVNERPHPWQGSLRLRLYRHGETQVGAAETALVVPARGARTFSSAALLGGFTDTTYAYRFGPPGHDLAAAFLVSDAATVEGEAYHFPVGRPAGREPNLGLEASITTAGQEQYALSLRTRRFAYAVALNVPGFAGDDDYFSVAPGEQKTVPLRRTGTAGEPRGSVQAMNAWTPVRIGAPPTPAVDKA
jgi:beta-mannosidase